ncbi:MAG: ROK family protein [Anaerolineae bacterium]|nr:ROK family protein [Anaerolineae bacterium]MDW8172146.1 ROK family protein [Anaerolineae bacterium]
MAILAFDFGGTRTRAGWFDDQLRLLRRAEMASDVERGPEDTLARMVELGRSVQDGAPRAIGVAGPGPLDPISGVIHHAWTLTGWREVAIGPHLAQAFSAPAHLQNDGNCGALAEYRVGAGRGCDPLIYLTLSTGIGGGVILGGELFSGWRGLAAEPGHQVFRLADGQVRKLEELASGTALGLRAAQRLGHWPDDTALRQAQPLSGQAVGEAALRGDPLALEIVREAATWLGLGLVNLLHLFNPRAVVLGGSVSRLGDLLLEPVRHVISEHIMTPGFFAPDLLRPAALGDDVCLIGAAWHAFSTLSRD